MKIKKKSEDVFLGITLFVLLLYVIFNKDDRCFALIWLIITAIPFLEKLWSPKWLKSSDAQHILSNFKFSSFLFVLGALFYKFIEYINSLPGDKLKILQGELNPLSWKLFLLITVYIILFLYALAYLVINEMRKKDHVIEELIDANEKSNITDWDKFLEIVKNGGGNVITAVGNLLSLSTKLGSHLLAEFLQENTNNIVNLIMSEDMCKSDYIKIIKSNIDDSLWNRINLIIHEPFWFIQGFVIVGKKNSIGGEFDMSPLGCFYYKIRGSQSESMPAGGVFTDLKEKNIDPYLYQGIRTYHFLLSQLEYISHPYTIKKIITKEISTKEGEKVKDPKFTPIKRITTLAGIS